MIGLKAGLFVWTLLSWFYLTVFPIIEGCIELWLDGDPYRDFVDTSKPLTLNQSLVITIILTLLCIVIFK